MRHAKVVLLAAGIAAACGTGVALASGGPPPVTPADQPANTVIAVGYGRAAVDAPRRQTDRTVDRAVVAARTEAMPAAIAAARREAAALGQATGLRPGAVVAVRRDVSPPGYWNAEDGNFGPGKWCGRIYTGRRTVRRADGTIRRVSRFRDGCKVPKDVAVRLSVTFAATR
jgi:hypothetical protein